MTAYESIPMTADGEVLWRHYKCGAQGSIYLATDLQPELEDQTVELLRGNNGDLCLIGWGFESNVHKSGSLAVKDFLEGLAKNKPGDGGNLQNLKANVATSHALVGGAAVKDTDWRVHGIGYHGALIPERPTTSHPQRWVVDYIPGLSLDEASTAEIENLSWPSEDDLSEVVKKALARSGEETRRFFIDFQTANYIVPEDVLDGTDLGPDHKLFRIDTGARG